MKLAGPLKTRVARAEEEASEEESGGPAARSLKSRLVNSRRAPIMDRAWIERGGNSWRTLNRH